MNEVFVARHATTPWNGEQRLQGSKDIGLSEIGFEESAGLAGQLEGFGISIIITSELQRAYQTAEIIGKVLHVPIVRYAGFNERSFGELEGKVWPEVQPQLVAAGKSMDDYAEPYEPFAAKVRATFADVLEIHKDKDTGLFICHGGVLRVLLEDLRQTPAVAGDIGFEHKNATSYRFRRAGDRWIESA